MNRSNTTQKKNTVMNYVYATLIGLLVVACAVTVALINSSGISNNGLEVGDNIPVSTTTYTVPMKNATIAKDYSMKELQYNDTLNQWEIHKAIDFLAGDDTNVYAAANGNVSKVYTNYLEGTVVEITHNDGIVTVYKSLASTNVEVGDKVNSGTIIGEAGTSMAQELNTGAHLHFEMLKNGKKVNPNDYIDLGIK